MDVLLADVCFGPGASCDQQWAESGVTTYIRVTFRCSVRAGEIVVWWARMP